MGAVVLSSFGSADAEAAGLLAPTTACSGQENASLPDYKQERALKCLINRARAARGLPRLDRARKLRRSADRKSVDIIACQDFSHTACGRDAFYWIQRVGYGRGCWGGGENIAWGTGSYATARSTMSGWLRSTGHRRILLTRKYRNVGLGVRKGPLSGHEGGQIWTAHLGYRC